MEKAEAAELCEQLSKLIGDHPYAAIEDERKAMAIVNRLIGAAPHMGPQEHAKSLRGHLERWFHPRKLKDEDPRHCRDRMLQDLYVIESHWEVPRLPEDRHD